MKTFLIFFAVTFISFLGSVHPGPVNLSVIQVALTRSRKQAFLLGLGGSLPEIPYAILALSGLHFLQENPDIFHWFRLMVIPLLGIMGLNLFFSKPKENLSEPEQSPQYQSFAKGLALSFFNPQILPYWTAIAIAFQSSEWLMIQTLPHKIAFVLGTSTGAYLLNALYAYIADRKKVSILQFFDVRLIDKFTGLSLLGMACWQLWQVIR